MQLYTYAIFIDYDYGYMLYISFSAPNKINAVLFFSFLVGFSFYFFYWYIICRVVVTNLLLPSFLSPVNSCVNLLLIGLLHVVCIGRTHTHTLLSFRIFFVMFCFCFYLIVYHIFRCRTEFFISLDYLVDRF